MTAVTSIKQSLRRRGNPETDTQDPVGIEPRHAVLESLLQSSILCMGHAISNESERLREEAIFGILIEILLWRWDRSPKNSLIWALIQNPSRFREGVNQVCTPGCQT